MMLCPNCGIANKGQKMDESTLNYRMAEFLQVCPLPVQDADFFIIQIRSQDGRKTKNLNITPDEFRKIEKILFGVQA
jgi:hypothetical protein